MVRIDIGARGVVHDPAHHAAEAVHRGGAGLAIGAAETFLLALEQPPLQRRAGRGEGQQPLPAVRAAGRLRDVALIHQRAQHAGERLFGYAQNAQQIGNGNAGIAADEMQRTMMRAAQPEFLQDHVGGIGEVAVGEEQQVLRACRQVGARAGSTFDSGMAGIPRSRADIMSALLTYRRVIIRSWPAEETILRRMRPWSLFLSTIGMAGSGGTAPWSPGVTRSCMS